MTPTSGCNNEGEMSRRIAVNSDQVSKVSKLSRRKCFGEDIRCLSLSRNIGNSDITIGLVLAYHVILYVNMLCLLMILGVFD